MSEKMDIKNETIKFLVLFSAMCVLAFGVFQLFKIDSQDISVRDYVGGVALLAIIALSSYQSLIEKRNNVVAACLATSLIVLIAFSYPIEAKGYTQHINEYTSLQNALLSVVALLTSILWIAYSTKGGDEKSLSGKQKFTLFLLAVGFILVVYGLKEYSGYIAELIATLSVGLAVFQVVVTFKELKNRQNVIFATATIIIDILILGFILRIN